MSTPSTTAASRAGESAAEGEAVTGGATAVGRRPRVLVQRHPFLSPESHEPMLRAHAGVETVLARTIEECEREVGQAEGAVVFGWRPADLLARAPRLRWLQLMTAGADELPRSILESPLAVCATKGPMAPPIAEHAVGLLLAVARGLPGYRDAQRAGEWRRERSAVAKMVQLTGKTVLVVGTGAIGGQVARICRRGFAMRVLGMARTRRGHPDVDGYVEREQLPAALAEAHFVILCAPHTPETHHLIDAAALAAMRPEAILVNVARGGLVDEGALAAALAAGAIGGAGLDTFAVEPLPPESPLWALPNVLITPHLAPASDRVAAALVEFWTEQIRRFATGQPLRGLVDPAAGY
jgi:phosphoglycerate dehydrogenase-like enzyme